MHLRLALITCATLAACAAPPPSAVATAPDWIVLVKSARVPPWSPWITLFAHHTWIDVKRGDEAQWWRAEVRGLDVGVVYEPITAAQARKDLWLDRRAVRLLATLEGEPARRIAERLEPLCNELDARYAADYQKWPGPNSNTFVADLARELPDLAFVFDGNAVGKDWPGWFDAGVTSSKSGLHLDTPVAGAALGVREGVELHLLGLTLGVRLFPPSLALPFLPELPAGLWNERWCRVPPAPADAANRLELPEGDDAVTEATFALDRDGRGEVVLVDAESGQWAALSIVLDAPGHAPPYGAFAVSERCHFVAFDRDSSNSGLLDPAAPIHSRVDFDRCAAQLRFAIDDAGAATVAVRLARRDEP